LYNKEDRWASNISAYSRKFTLQNNQIIFYKVKII